MGRNREDTPELATRNINRKRDWTGQGDEDHFGRERRLRDLHRAGRRITHEINQNPEEVRRLGRARSQARRGQLRKDIDE
jgi:hypothetical protein